MWQSPLWHLVKPSDVDVPRPLRARRYGALERG